MQKKTTQIQQIEKGETKNYAKLPPLSIQQPNRIWQRRAADVSCYLDLMSWWG